MGKFRVTSPDGRQFEITAPDGASQEDILQYAQTQFSGQSVSQKEPSIYDKAKRIGGLALRGGMRGLAAIPTFMAEGAAYPLRALTGGKYFPSPSSTLENYMSSAGLPEPESRGERIGTDVVTGLSGAGALSSGARLLANAPGVLGRVAQSMSRQPLGQLVAGGTGAGSASVAKEAGAGPLGQFAAGLAGAFVPAAAAGAASTGAKVARALVDPATEQGQQRILGNVLRSATGKDSTREINALSNAKEIVPGSKPTAADAAESGGISALQRSIAQSSPEQFAERTISQNASRLNSLRGLAKTPQEMSAAEAARESAVKPLYESAKKVVVPSDGNLKMLLAKPSVKQAWSRAQRIAEESGESIKLGVDEPEKLVESRVLSQSGKPFTEYLPAKYSSYTGKGLHYLKMGLDDLLDDPTSSIGKAEKAAIVKTREQLGEWLADKIPEYKQARATYAELSRPIDQMKIGQALLNKLEPALNQGGLPIRMRAASFADALRKGDELAKQVTGFKGATLKSILSKEQIDSLNNIRLDLARSAVGNELGRGVGSNTFQNLAQENLFQSAGVQGLPQLLSRPIQITNYLLRGVYGSANREMREKLTDILLDPQKTAQLMRAPDISRLDSFARSLATGRKPSMVGLPATINANQR